MDKASLRKRYASKEIIDEKINKIIVETAACFIEKYDDIELVGIYLALMGEIDLSPLMMRFPDKKFAIPKIKNGNIFFTKYYPASPLQTNAELPGYYEPVSNIEVFPRLIFIPALAYDIRGYRLGRGKGHYDKYLAKHNIIGIGVSIGSKLLMSLPNEPHDFRMNYVITEDIILEL
jgi:5-formyltetrahydrofolate cyclo-ligase